MTLGVDLGFLSHNFGRWWKRMVLCHSLNAGSVVGIPWGDGDTQTLPCAKEIV